MKLHLKKISFMALLTIAMVMPSPVLAETRITYKAAKTTSSYYQMAVQIAEATKEGSAGDIVITVEEGQGAVQAVKQVPTRGKDYIFAALPGLVRNAQLGKSIFEGEDNPKYSDIRVLYPIPGLNMHFVSSKASGVTSFAELEGKTILLAKGSFGAREATKYLNLFGLEGKVNISNAELSNAVPALKNGQIDAFVTSSSWPAPSVIESSASIGVNILSLSDEQIEATKRSKLVIPAGTYSGQEEAITTTGLLVYVYGTAGMSDDVAYELTKIYWEQKEKMGDEAAWWNGIDENLMKHTYATIHPGAERYYREKGYDFSK